jgi:pantoate--beta-alanine ligase
MRVTNTIADARSQVKEWQRSGLKIGFVPTMGALHAGHESLIRRSVAENDRTVVSIFVNPTQFAPDEDLEAYPRTLEADSQMCESAGVDLVFCPTAEEMYSPNATTFVDMSGSALTQSLCGKSRPAHFRGVCTVVAKLLNIVTPSTAYFGQKDAQQLAVIRRMVQNLNMDVNIAACPIVREADGLAMSSRNAYLAPDERRAAAVLSRALSEGERLIDSGERDSGKIAAVIRSVIESEPLARIDYVEVVDGGSLESVGEIRGSVLAAIAVYIGKTRLIDNFAKQL